jgi:hypothetical protein
MEQRSNVAALKDVQIKSLKVECASGMEQRLWLWSNDAALKDVQIKSKREEYAGDTEQTDSRAEGKQSLD